MSTTELSAEGGDERFRVRVDHGLCSGTAHCRQPMPEVFVVNARKSWIRPGIDWSVVDPDDLHRTADACPW